MAGDNQFKWRDVPLPWQACFEQAWLAYRAGCVPIGAAIVSAEGEILHVGRNHIHEARDAATRIISGELGHAEINALVHFDRQKVSPYPCRIYSTLEPCPLCMGAIYMVSVRNIHFAARDPYAGSTNLLGATPYLSRKSFQVHQDAPAGLEALAVVLHTDFLLRRCHDGCPPENDPVISNFRDYLPRPVSLAGQLFSTGTLQRYSESSLTIADVYENLAPQLN